MTIETKDAKAMRDNFRFASLRIKTKKVNGRVYWYGENEVDGLYLKHNPKTSSWARTSKKAAVEILNKYGITAEQFIAYEKGELEIVEVNDEYKPQCDWENPHNYEATGANHARNLYTTETETATTELPTGNITVNSGIEAWAIVGKHFPKGNLEFYRAGKGFNNEDTFCYTLDEIIYVHATCTPDNKRVKCIEIVNTYEESESERNILTVYINHDAEVNTATEDNEEIKFCYKTNHENAHTNESATNTTPEYKYYIKSRRPIFGAAPNGYIKAVSGEVHEPVRRPNGTYSPKCRIYFAAVIYDKPLTDEQIADYDLAVSNETFELLNATTAQHESPTTNTIVETDGSEEDDDDSEVFDLLPNVDELNDTRSDIEKEFDKFADEDTDRNDRYNRGEKIAADLTAKLRPFDPTVEVTFKIDYEYDEDGEDTFYLEFDGIRGTYCTATNAESIFHALKSDIAENAAEHSETEPSEQTKSDCAIANALDGEFQKVVRGNDYMDVTTQNGEHIVTSFGAAYIEPDWRAMDGYVFGNHYDDILARYETPAQVETVINQLKAAIERGDTEFEFPTIEELATPEIDKDTTADSLTRAMTIALENYQDFCRVGNLTGAANELSLYNICRKAMTELWKGEAA